MLVGSRLSGDDGDVNKKGTYQAVYVVVRIQEIETSCGIPGKGLGGRKVHLCCHFMRHGYLSSVETQGVPELLGSCQVFGRIFRGVFEWLGYVLCEIGWMSML